MRLKFGRPDIARYRAHFDAPEAGDATAVGVMWMGVSTLLVTDGTSAILTDGFFSRPGLVDVAARKLTPSIERIEAALSRSGIGRLDAVLPVHTHYDHALDSAAVAERTGAILLGGDSAANLARGQGLPEDRIAVATAGEAIELGAFEVTLVESAHCPPDRYPGSITAPVIPPAKASAYRCGQAWSTLVQHRPSGRRLLIQGSAGFVPGALAGRHADAAYLGVGQLGVQPELYIRQYWNETVRAVGARRVVLIHWDDFFRPLTAPLRALPYAGDDLDVTMRVLGALAERDGVALHLPSLWQRVDPWAGI